VLASVVSLLNPGQLILGGGLSMSGELLPSAVRPALYARALPLASRDLLEAPLVCRALRGVPTSMPVMGLVGLSRRRPSAAARVRTSAGTVHPVRCNEPGSWRCGAASLSVPARSAKTVRAAAAV
jgi:hypothetical protein